MKKTISVLLAVVLAFGFSSAFAKRLDYQPERGAIVKFDEFKPTFTDLMAIYGYSIEWPSGPRSEDGYEVYEVGIARMDDGTMDLEVYTENGAIAFFVLTGSVYDERDNLKWLFDSARGACNAVFCILYLEDNANGGSWTAEGMVEAASEDWTGLLNGLQADISPDSTQYAYTTDVLGLPVGITVYQDGSTAVMYVYIMNKNSRLRTE